MLQEQQEHGDDDAEDHQGEGEEDPESQSESSPVTGLVGRLPIAVTMDSANARPAPAVSNATAS